MNFVIGWNEPDIRIIKKEICNNFLAFYGSVRQNVVGYGNTGCGVFKRGVQN